jgi:hypothetical protein
MQIVAIVAHDPSSNVELACGKRLRSCPRHTESIGPGEAFNGACERGPD